MLLYAPNWLRKTFQIQCIFVLVLGLIFLVIDIETAYSIVLGGFVYGLPQYWSIRREFSNSKAGVNIQLSLLQLYRLEIIKISLTVGLFMVMFVGIKPLNGLALLLTYMGLHIAAFIVPLIIKKPDS